MIKADKKTLDKMEKSFEKAMKHPYWKKEYEDAPSDECRDYLKFTYYFSEHFDPDAEDAGEFDRIQADAEKKLKAKDWEYLKTTAPNSPFAGYCDQMIAKLSK